MAEKETNKTNGEERETTFPPLEEELKRTLNLLIREHPKARIAFLLSGFSPFMGQTADLDEYFIHTVMQKRRIKNRKAVRILFSPASFYPRDQISYADGFKEYYGRQLGVRTCVFKFHSYYHLHRVEHLVEMLNRYSGWNDLIDIGFLCLSNSMETMSIVRHQIRENHDCAVDILRELIQGEIMDRLDAVERLFVFRVFVHMLKHGPRGVPELFSWLDDRKATFTRKARAEYVINKKMLEDVDGFYGGGGDPEFLYDMYRYKIDRRNHWTLFRRAWKRGVPFLGYSAHSILYGRHHHEMIPYNERNRNAAYLKSLKRRYPFVRPRKRDYFLLRPMMELVPMSLIVHYERQVADLRKFELNYFDETVPEDVMSLRNNCAIACFCEKDGDHKIMGFWSQILPPSYDKTSEIRYIHYYNGKPCKLRHGEVLTIQPNEPFPGSDL